MPILAKTAPLIPAETATEARKVYNIQHIYLRIGDRLDAILSRIDLALLDPSASRNGETVMRLALATAFQYAELLPDPLAAQATLSRMDWKYALRLPVRHPGLTAAALCEFRRDLTSFTASAIEFTRLLEILGYYGLFSRSVGQALTAAEVLSTVCQVTQLHLLDQELRASLSVLAGAAPDWLRAVALPHWYERYKKSEDEAGSGSLLQESQVLAGDAYRLVDALNLPTAQNLGDLAEVQVLSRLLEEQFQRNGETIQRQLPRCNACSCRL